MAEPKRNYIDYEKTKVGLPLVAIVFCGGWFLSVILSTAKTEAKLEVAEIKTDMAVVRTQVADISEDQKEIKEQLRDMSKRLEDYGKKVTGDV